jgi:hypothetical protein
MSSFIYRDRTPPQHCKLCLEARPLQKSHIIPSSIFRRTMRKYDGKLIGIDDSETGPVQHTSDTWWDYLLCKSCELYLSTYEKIGIETMRGEPKGILRHHDYGVTFNGHSYSDMKLYFTAILWRAAISTLGPFSKVFLPPSLAEQTRLSLRSGNADTPIKLACRLMVLHDPTPALHDRMDEEAMKELVISPRVRKNGGCFSFIFIFERYFLEIYVPLIPPALRGQHGILKRTGPWFVPRLNFLEVPELMDVLGPGIRKADQGMTRL